MPDYLARSLATFALASLSASRIGWHKEYGNDFLLWLAVLATMIWWGLTIAFLIKYFSEK